MSTSKHKSSESRNVNEIPEEWKQHQIIFWGTEFGFGVYNDDESYVGVLSFSNNEWKSFLLNIGEDFVDDSYKSAVLS